MDREPRFLLREVDRGPLLAFVRQEQGPDHRPQDRIAGRDLLQIGVGHGYAAGHGAAVVRPDLVDVAMDAAVGADIFEDAVDERPVYFVVGPRAGDGLCQRVPVVCQERLGERRGAFLGPRIGDVKLVEGFADRRCGPDIDRGAGHVLDLFKQAPFPLHHFLFRALGPVYIDPYAAARHLHKVWDQRRFEVPDVLNAFLLDQGFEMGPQFQRQGGVHLGVFPDIHGGQLPHLALWIDPKVARCLDQALFAFDLAEIVVAQRIEAVAKSVLVKQVGRHHRVDHAAAHVEALGPQPAQIVLGVVHDFVRTGV